MEYCRLKGVLLQAWSPLAQGILTGKANLDDQSETVKETALLAQRSGRAPRDHCRGHPAGLASQIPGEDPARVGNFPSGSIAGLRQGTFGFFKPRRIVLSLAAARGATYALKCTPTGRSSLAVPRHSPRRRSWRQGIGRKRTGRCGTELIVHDFNDQKPGDLDACSGSSPDRSLLQTPHRVTMPVNAIFRAFLRLIRYPIPRNFTFIPLHLFRC